MENTYALKNCSNVVTKHIENEDKDEMSNGSKNM